MVEAVINKVDLKGSVEVHIEAVNVFKVHVAAAVFLALWLKAVIDNLVVQVLVELG
jgi:hypothetical protein